MSNLDTSCKECIFTEDKDLTQIGCKTDYIAKFHKLDIEILDAYDKDKEFWVIKDRICPSYRTSRWKYIDKTFEEQMEQIKEESKIPYQVIIFTNNNIKDVEITLDSLMTQTIPPHHITLIKPIDCNLTPRILTDLCKNHPLLNGNWRVECIVNPETNRGNAIDFVIDVIPKLYYAVFNAGFKVYSRLFEDISNKMLEELTPLTITKPDSNGNGEIVHYYLHKQYQGNAEFPLIEKIELEHEIPMISEICPNF